MERQNEDNPKRPEGASDSAGMSVRRYPERDRFYDAIEIYLPHDLPLRYPKSLKKQTWDALLDAREAFPKKRIVEACRAVIAKLATSFYAWDQAGGLPDLAEECMRGIQAGDLAEQSIRGLVEQLIHINYRDAERLTLVREVERSEEWKSFAGGLEKLEETILPLARSALKPTHTDLRERWLLVHSELRRERLLGEAQKLSRDDLAIMWPEQWLREVKPGEKHGSITADASRITAAQAEKRKEWRRQFHWLTPEDQEIVRSELLRLHKSIADARRRRGQNINKLRKECGWSFYELAKATELDKKLILGHVNKGKGMHPATLERYAEVFTEKLGRTVTVAEIES